MANDGFAVFGQHHGHHIKAAGPIDRLPLREPVSGNPAELTLLGVGHRVFRIGLFITPAGLDLNEGDRPLVQNDQVNLTHRAAVVAGENLVSEPPKVPLGQALPCVSDSQPVKHA